MQRKSISRILIAGFVALVLIGASFYFILTQGVSTSVKNAILNNESVLSRAEAGNISSFFQTFGKSLVVITHTFVTQEDLDAFVEEWKSSGIVGGIALTDSEGVVTINSNILGNKAEGTSLADRDYFIWAKNESNAGNYYVGQPVIARLGGSIGQPIIPVASPIFQNGVFKGVVVASVKMGELAKNYLGLMSISSSTDVFLIYKDGEVLYSNNSRPDLVNTSNAFNNVNGHPFLESSQLANSIKEVIDGNAKGNSTVSYADPVSGKVETHLVAYTPFVLGNQKFLIVMSSPLSNLNNISSQFYIRQLAVFSLVALTIILLGIIIIREKVSIVVSNDRTTLSK